jgi:hypothetical protein
MPWGMYAIIVYKTIVNKLLNNDLFRRRPLVLFAEKKASSKQTNSRLLHCDGRLTTRYVSTETWSEAKTWPDQQVVITMWSHGASGCSFVCFRIPNTWQLFAVLTKANYSSERSTNYWKKCTFTESQWCLHWVRWFCLSGIESCRNEYSVVTTKMGSKKAGWVVARFR